MGSSMMMAPATSTGSGSWMIRAAGKILIMPSGKGSSVVQLDGLYKLMMRGNAPAAIVVQEADTVLVAAVAAMETPMVHRVDPAFFQEVQTGMELSLDADNGTITIL